jgi:hypothetical protein
MEDGEPEPDRRGSKKREKGKKKKITGYRKIEKGEPAAPSTEEIGKLEREVKNAEELVSKAKTRSKIAKRRVRSLEEELDFAESGEEKEILENDLEEARKKEHRVELSLTMALSSLDKANQHLDEARARAKKEVEVKPEKEEDVPDEEEPVLEKEEKPEDIYEVEEEPEDMPVRPRRKFKWTPLKAVATIIVVFIILPVTLYSLVIPRTNAVVRILYSEGFQGNIIIDAEVKNTGTVDITDLNMTITILDVNDLKVAEMYYEDPMVYARTDSKADAITFPGNQRVDYSVLMEITFFSEGSSFFSSETFYIDGPFMNYVFEDNIEKWIP